MITLVELEEFSDITPAIRALSSVKISGDLILWVGRCSTAPTTITTAVDLVNT